MLEGIQSVLAFVVVIGLIIFVHELGHFLAAKWAGVYTPRFSLGFGPALWRKRWGETEYQIAVIPLGGYVRMASREDETMAMLEGGGERPALKPETVGGSGAQVVPDEELPGQRVRGKDWDPDALAPFGPRPVPPNRMFESKPLGKRLVIMVAGVTMNFLLGFIVFTGLVANQGRLITRTRVVGGVAELPGAGDVRSRLAIGDTIQAVDGHPVTSWNDILITIDSGSAEAVTLRTNRGEVRIPVVGAGTPSRRTVARALQAYEAPIIDQVAPSSPAARGGLQAGDSIARVNGAPVRTWAEAVGRIRSSPGQNLQFEVKRAGQMRTLSIRPDSVPHTDPTTGRREQIGQIGAALRAVTDREPVSFSEAIGSGWRLTWGTTGEVLRVVKGLVTREVSVKQLGGPIAIARASAEAAKSGLERLFGLVAFLSINVAVLNLLPIPILDGGQIVLNVVEAARGSSFSARTREYILRFGLLAIALLFVLVMFNDIKREIETLLQRLG